MSSVTEKKKAGLLTAAEIFEIDDLQVVEVEVPEWTPGWTRGGRVKPRKVRLRQLSAKKALKFAELSGSKAGKDSIVRLMADSIVGEDNELLFEYKDLEALRDKSFAVFQRIQNVAMELNGFTNPEAAEDEAGND